MTLKISALVLAASFPSTWLWNRRVEQEARIRRLRRDARDRRRCSRARRGGRQGRKGRCRSAGWSRATPATSFSSIVSKYRASSRAPPVVARRPHRPAAAARRAQARNACSRRARHVRSATGSSPCIGEEHIGVKAAALMAGADHVDDAADPQRLRLRGHRCGPSRHRRAAGRRSSSIPTQNSSGVESSVPSTRPTSRHVIWHRQPPHRCWTSSARRMSAGSPRR